MIPVSLMSVVGFGQKKKEWRGKCEIEKTSWRQVKRRAKQHFELLQGWKGQLLQKEMSFQSTFCSTRPAFIQQLQKLKFGFVLDSPIDLISSLLSVLHQSVSGTGIRARGHVVMCRFGLTATPSSFFFLRRCEHASFVPDT